MSSEHDPMAADPHTVGSRHHVPETVPEAWHLDYRIEQTGNAFEDHLREKYGDNRYEILLPGLRLHFNGANGKYNRDLVLYVAQCPSSSSHSNITQNGLNGKIRHDYLYRGKNDDDAFCVWLLDTSEPNEHIDLEVESGSGHYECYKGELDNRLPNGGFYPNREDLDIVAKLPKIEGVPAKDVRFMVEVNRGTKHGTVHLQIQGEQAYEGWIIPKEEEVIREEDIPRMVKIEEIIPNIGHFATV